MAYITRLMPKRSAISRCNSPPGTGSLMGWLVASTAQAAVGKGMNQLNYAVGLAQAQVSNFSAAESRIRDTDVAAGAANLTKSQILEQASLAAMAQANSASEVVLSLLKG